MRHLLVTDSDIIEAIGFEPSKESPAATRGALEIVFKSSPDQLYRYEDVGFSEFLRLVAADSIGKTFHELFRKTKYPFTKSARPTLKK